MRRKRIAIIGAGTAGCVTSALYATNSNPYNYDLDWYFDPSIPPQAVGEGTTLDVVKLLFSTIDFSWEDLHLIDGNIKSGIYKSGWSNKSFVHRFIPPHTAIHFNANKLQNLILERVQEKYNVNIIHGNVDKENVEADNVIQCTGFPNDDNVDLSNNIYVNSAYVTQCYWNYPKFNYTLTIARPYGWVWGIPLNNRCSIGYMYNNTINTKEEVMEDVKEIFDIYNLEPSNDTNAFSFKSFHRNTNYTERYAYNGNASFFLEPLEATSITSMVYFATLYGKYLFQDRSLEKINSEYSSFLDEIEQMINLHYIAGSIYDTPFWEMAKERSTEFITKKIKEQAKFKNILKTSMSKTNLNQFVFDDTGYGTWWEGSYFMNINGLEIKNKLAKIMEKL